MVRPCMRCRARGGRRPAARSSGRFTARSPTCRTTTRSPGSASMTPPPTSRGSPTAPRPAAIPRRSRSAARSSTRRAGLPAMPAVPRRHCHGDLKISNVLFATAPLRGVCLVDLDTLGLSTMAFELGDAMRAWCNPHGEDASRVAFDLAIFAAAIRGFRDAADPVLTADEKRAIVVGLETVCLELAARFAVDAFRDEYFGWDPARFPSRRAHNLVRARGQLARSRSIPAARG